MKQEVTTWICVTFAIVSASTMICDHAAAFQNGQDARFRAQVRQQMELRSLRQRIASERASLRAQRAAERANRAARRAQRRARSKK